MRALCTLPKSMCVVLLWVGASLQASFARVQPALEPINPPSTSLNVRYEHELFSADIDNAPLADVLAEIAQKARLKVRFLDPEQRNLRVLASFGPTSLERALRAVLNSVSYVYYVEGDEHGVLILSSESHRAPVATLDVATADAVNDEDAGADKEGLVAMTCQPCDALDGEDCTPC